jgi:antitoxin ParD1/3/4
MAMVKKSITVTGQQESWIQAQMATGNYGTDSELIREALREKKMRMDEFQLIRSQLIEGEESGIGIRTPEEILEDSKQALGQNAAI